MTTTLSGIAEELERLELDLIARVIGAYHTTRLSDVPANIHIRSKAHVREAFERYAAALIRTADDREKVLREALKPFARMATAFDYWCEDVMPSLRYPINGADEEMAISDGVPDAVGCLTEQDFQRARQALGGTNA